MLVIIGLLLAGNWSTAFPEDTGQQGKRYLVATVLGEPVYLDQLDPAEAVVKSKELGEAEFGRWLREYRGRRLLVLIYLPLLKTYAKQQGLVPTGEEINALSKLMDEALKKVEYRIQPETPYSRRLRRQFAYALILEWKTCKGLYEKYGGRVAIGSLGACTPIEGRKAFLQEQYKAGRFEIQNIELERLFWDSVMNERFADGILTGKEIKEFFSHPPWESSPERANNE